jgi:hypothetical protein
MIAAEQQHIECLVSRVWGANSDNAAHSTGTQAIVSFHMHEHGNSGNIAKACDEVGTEDEKASQEGTLRKKLKHYKAIKGPYNPQKPFNGTLGYIKSHLNC